MTVPRRLVARRLGHLHDATMMKVDKKGLIQTNAFRKSLTKNASQLRRKKVC